MAKIKFDLRGSNADEARELGTLESPKPGVYRCKVKEVNPGFSKGDDGKADRKRPRVEVIFQVAEGKYKNAQLWYYLTFGEGFPTQKYDQFLQAFGLASKRKRQGEWDTNQVVNKTCLVRVKGGTNQSGDYRGEVGGVLADDGREMEGDSGGGSSNDWDGGESFEDEQGDGDEAMEDEEGDAEVDEDTRREELSALQVKEIKEIAKEYEIGVSGKKKAEVIEEIIAYELSDDGDDEAMEDEDDEMLEDEDESSTEYLTEEELKAMEIPQLKETAAQFDVDTKGKKKSQVIAAILEAQGADEGDGEDDGEAPF